MGVLYVAGVEDGGVACEPLSDSRHEAGCVLQQGLGPIELAPVGGPDGVGGGPDYLAGEPEGLLAGGVGVGEGVEGPLADAG